MSYAPFEEMESYFDFDQSYSAASPTTGFASSNTTIDPTNIMRQSEHTSQIFSGPSFEYDRYRQLTGLPAGAVSNVTEFNEINPDYSFNTNVASFNFSNVAYNGGLDFDADFNAPQPSQASAPAFFFPSDASFTSETENLVDDTPFQAVPLPPTGTRLYPGMHSQQAQQAKAEALARQQRQQQMGQQIMLQRQQQEEEQQQQHLQPQIQPPSCRSSVSKQSVARSSMTLDQDPVIEDRISRLLDQMRHNNTVSSMDEEGISPGSSGDAGRIARMKKDEEDMDEDERLLASDEGKKLSSKERRQLRNKVSARAFRSRRKEYITQLEGEVAVKTTECNEMKARNRNLTEQNQQLTRLTQTLLRHPAFATFLSEMSHDPSLLEPIQNTTTSSMEEGEIIPKQEQTHDTQINLAIVPQTRFDMLTMNLGSSHWDTNFSFQQPQVFSILELPQGPSMAGLSNLSGKPMDESESGSAFTTTSKALEPKLIRPCSLPVSHTASESKPFDATGIDKDDDRFVLYMDSSDVVNPSVASIARSYAPSYQQQALNLKTPITTKLVVSSTSSDDATAITQINNLFVNLEFYSQRMEGLIPQLFRL